LAGCEKFEVSDMSLYSMLSLILIHCRDALQNQHKFVLQENSDPNYMAPLYS